MSAGFGESAPSGGPMGYGKPTGAHIRVSDADREATAAELREHYAAGRLTADELNERLDQAFAAKTGGDLGAVMHDLPSLRPGGTPLAGTGQPSTGAGWTGSADGSDGPGWHGDHGWHGGPGSGGQGAWGPGRAVGSVISSLVAVCLLAVFAVTAAFSFGHNGSRPIGIALIIAALAMLRRLFFRRRRRAPRGRARRRR
jgi:DUF1707 SHOCT-like domain